jgi:hypothetical protein
MLSCVTIVVFYVISYDMTALNIATRYNELGLALDRISNIELLPVEALVHTSQHTSSI